MINKLENILSEGLSEINKSSTSRDHKLMQISYLLFALDEKWNNIIDAKLEYPLIYGKSDSKKHKNNYWKADVVLLYYENGKRVVEFVEAETIKISRYHHRIKNLVKKEDTILKAVEFDQDNILKSADEIRFSIIFNSKGVNYERLPKYAEMFRHSMRDHQNRYYKDDFDKNHKIKEYKIYFLRKNPNDISLKNIYSIIKWKNMKNLDRIYTSLNWNY